MSFFRYGEYKESKAAWFGDIPSHWSAVKLRWLAKLSSGDSITSDNIEVDGEYPVYGGNGVRGYTDRFTHQGLHVLIGRQGALCGNINYAHNRFWASEHAVVVVPTRDLDIMWLGEVLRSMNLNQYSIAAAQPGLAVDRVSGLAIPVPPKPEQTKIARFLDHETAKIDTLIREQERLIALLQEKRHSLTLSSYQTGGWQAVRLDNIVVKTERPVYQKDDEEYIALGLFNRGRGLFHKEPKEKKDMGDSDFFWVESGDLILSGQFAWEGSVALAGEKETGTVVSHRYPIIRGKEGVVLTEYIYALFTTSHGDFLLNENSRGAAGRNKPLNIGNLLKEKIKVPPMALQTQIAELVHKEKGVRIEAESQRGLLLERRSALISAAVTGKIDVRDWQPPADKSAFDQEVLEAGLEVTA